MFSESPEQFKSVIRNTHINGQVILPCDATSNTDIVWRYQQHCFNFEHGTHQICAGRKEFKDGDQVDNGSLSVIADSTKMAGVYTCEERNGRHLYSRVHLNVYSEYLALTAGFFYNI